MYSGWSTTPLRVVGFPIRTSADRRLIGTSPRLIAAFRVLHRFSLPRHPPLTLYSLGSKYKDARARYEILKGQAGELERRLVGSPEREQSTTPVRRSAEHSLATEERNVTHSSASTGSSVDAVTHEPLSWGASAGPLRGRTP